MIGRFGSCPTTLVAILAPFAFFFSPRARRGTLLTQDAKCVAGVALRDIEHFTFQSSAAPVAQKRPHSRAVCVFSVVVAKTQLFIVHAHPVGRQNAGQAWHIVTCNCSYNLAARQSMLQNSHHSRTFFVFLFRACDRRTIWCKSDLVWRAKIAPPALRAEIGRFAKEFV